MDEDEYARSENREERTSGKARAAAPPRKTVLLVDDEEIVHANVRAMLGRLGCEVHGAFDGTEAIRMLEELPCDLVVTDLIMPRLGGLELLAELNARGIRTPVVMITGSPTVRTALLALKLGAQDYVPKPFSRKDLLGPVSRALRLDRAESETESLSSVPPPSPAPLRPGDVWVLIHHSWARYQQDGTFLIGVERSFLQPVGPVRSAETVGQPSMLIQGYPGVRLVNDRGESHAVAMPLTGAVVEINHQALTARPTISADTWIFRIIANELASELPLLSTRSP